MSPCVTTTVVVQGVKRVLWEGDTRANPVRTFRYRFKSEELRLSCLGLSRCSVRCDVTSPVEWTECVTRLESGLPQKRWNRSDSTRSGIRWNVRQDSGTCVCVWLFWTWDAVSEAAVTVTKRYWIVRLQIFGHLGESGYNRRLTSCKGLPIEGIGDLRSGMRRRKRWV